MPTDELAGNAAKAAAGIATAGAADGARRGTSVSLRSLTRAFGATRALDEMSLDIAPGELVALVLGEFTMASLALKETFPAWIVEFDQLNANISVAASIFALFVTWIFLMLITVVATRQSRRTGGGEVTLFTVAPRETIGN